MSSMLDRVNSSTERVPDFTAVRLVLWTGLNGGEGMSGY